MRPLTASLLRRNQLVVALLLVVWGLIVAWQVVEHERVKEAAREVVLNRSRDITTTLGLVVRSQRRFGGMVSQDRLESALTELVRDGELISVALLNASGEIMVSAGPSIELDPRGVFQTAERWDARRVTVVNPVDLGATLGERGETNRPTIVLPRREPTASPREEEREADRARREQSGGESTATASSEPMTNRAERSERERPPWTRGGRPARMSEEEYRDLLQRRGLHGLALAMSADSYRRATRQDLWMRCLVTGLATVSVIGLGLASRNLAKSSDLQIRLFRASELNTHLKEMNLAAAGLAHETRNPLNIIRGLAQMISKQQDASVEVRRKTREIIDETDRVTAQLNEFINYSRPREVRRTAVALTPVLGEVARALTYDLEEKCVRLRVPDDLPVIEADEQLLRQALFNLLINAVQAAERGGDIEVAVWKQNGAGAVLEIRDNGPGVPQEQRAEIFKPYFTTHQKGTGLGLAVVQQIVLAHGWEIEYVPNEPRGAIFRITHLTPAARA